MFLLLFLYSACFQEHSKLSQQTVFCVTSNDSQSNSTCHTLKYYMSNSSLFFKSNTTFIFFSGEHLTDFNMSLQVTNVSGLTLEGKGATIQCNQQKNYFHFDHVQDLVIKSLNFYQCGIWSTNKPTGYSTLLLTNVMNFELTNTGISKSNYQGIFLNNTFGNILIAGSTFQYCQTSSNQPTNALYFSDCSNNDDTNVTIKDTLFQRNTNKIQKKLDDHIERYPFASGLTVTIHCPTVRVYLDNITTDGNVGGFGGNLAFILHTMDLYRVQPIIINNSQIRNGVADQGGGILASLVQPFSSNEQNSCKKHKILLITNTNFENNSASFVGGAISIRQKESNASIHIGDIVIENCMFTSNSLREGGHGGTAITSINFIVTEVDHHISPQFSTFIRNSSFHGNYVKKNKYMSIGTAVIFVKNNPYFKLVNVTIDSSTSSGILGLQSNLILGGKVTISKNKAESGGGIFLCQNAILYFESGLDLLISDNFAKSVGGGIAVESVCVVSKPICFFQLASSSSQNFTDITVHLHNNTANYSGLNLYGGSVDFCYMIENSAHDTLIPIKVFENVFDIHPNYSAGLPYVTSQPNHVCICIHNTTHCNESDYFHPTPVYPGQSFTISIILAGQLNGSTPGYVVASLEHNSGSACLDKGFEFHNLSKPICTNVTYVIKSSQTRINVTMKINAVQQGDISAIEYLPRYRQLKVKVLISTCPKGFSIEKQICKCESIFTNASDSVICNITNQTITVPPNIWIGYMSTKQVLVITEHCPPEYCNPGLSFIYTSQTDFDQDSQCQANRTGIMCGQCIEGYSVTFGAETGCVKCSNGWLWLILLYAFAGIFLVLVLTFFDLSVADGTINGLIFYANVVQANYSTLFIDNHKFVFKYSIKKMLTMFIGWLSLTNGVETCLYDGMNEYFKSWISFAFPLYIWIILGLIVLLSRRSVLVMRVIGSNAVKVLATLILLSYSKFILLIIAGFDFTTVKASDGHSWCVWTRDGSIPCFGTKHLLLFIFSVCLSVLLIPFTISLLFVQILERYSHLRIFCLVNKFKPLLDAYTGPYTDGARFWTGLLLLARIVVSLSSTLNGRHNYLANISLTAALMCLLLTIAFFLRNGIYKKKWIQILEGSLLLNLLLLLLASNYAAVNSGNQASFTFLFVGIAFFTFVGIIIYHLAKTIYTITCIQECIFAAKNKVMRRFQYQRIEPQENSNASRFLPHIVQFTEDREPLLADS